MKTLKRNQQRFWYCLYDSEIIKMDEYGNETSEKIVTYKDPVEMYANISQATGYSNTEQFGNLENYDKVIVTDDLTCPIDESSVLFIEKEPEFTDVTNIDYEESETLFGDDQVTPVTVRIPVPDYIVRRVAKSLNSVSIAVSKVKVS